MKRTAAKTSVLSREMALGLGGGELCRILAVSPRPASRLLSEKKNPAQAKFVFLSTPIFRKKKKGWTGNNLKYSF